MKKDEDRMKWWYDRNKIISIYVSFPLIFNSSISKFQYFYILLFVLNRDP